jgi:Ca2+-binding RTX toxin-like protein
MADIHGIPNVNDYLIGTSGDDNIFGDNWNDYLLGGKGDDHLRGNVGKDHLDGGPGNDVLDGGSAVDVLTGGGGSCDYDTFVFKNLNDHGPGHQNRDIVTDFSHNDKGIADGYGGLTWDPVHANVLNKAGFEVVHLDGHKGDSVVFDHAPGSLHWEFHLA